MSDPAAVNLLAVLSTPLMVALARAIYSDTPDRDPAELLDADLFGTEQALEDHLLGAFVPAVYLHPPAHERSGHYRHWDPDRVQQWLGFLSEHLDRLGTRDIAWWQMGNTVARPVRVLAIGLISGLAVTLVRLLKWILETAPAPLYIFKDQFGHELAFGILYGVVIGGAAGLLGGLASRGPRPARVQLKLRGWRGQLLQQIRVGLVSGLVLGITVGLLLWLTGAIAQWIDFAVWTRSAEIDFLEGLVVSELEQGLTNAVKFGFTLGLVGGVMGGIATPLDIRAAVSPTNLLGMNRRHAIAQSLVLGGGGGLALGLWSGPLLGLLAGLVVVLAGGLGMTAWGRWLILSRIWLPLTGRLPWAVTAFLEDAYQRGVLRQAGAVYQFRHARLQDHLGGIPHAADVLHQV